MGRTGRVEIKYGFGVYLPSAILLAALVFPVGISASRYFYKSTASGMLHGLNADFVPAPGDGFL